MSHCQVVNYYDYFLFHVLSNTDLVLVVSSTFLTHKISFGL